MPSHNLESVVVDGLEVIGYSVAGEETVVQKVLRKVIGIMKV